MAKQSYIYLKIERKIKMVKISDIATFLEVDFEGEDFMIYNATSLDNIKNNTLAFSKSIILKEIDAHALAFVPIDFEYKQNSIYSVIKVKNPRLTFAKVVNNFFPLCFLLIGL